MSSEVPPELMEEFEKVNSSSYGQQAVFFLNAFWESFGKDNAEKVWEWYKGFQKLDWEEYTLSKKDEREYKESSEINEFNASRFLEMQGQALSKLQFRQEFKKIDANYDKKMSLIEYCLYATKTSIKDLMEKPQESSPALDAAKAQLKEARKAIDAQEEEMRKLRILSEKEGVKAKAAKAKLAAMMNTENLEITKVVVKAESAVRKATKKLGSSPGQAFWLERELEEAKAYKPSGGHKTQMAAAMFDMGS